MMPASVPSICPIIASPWPRPITTLFGVARLAAVKQQMKAAGIKTSQIERRIVTAQADAYLDQHRDELLDEAAERIASWPGFRKIAEQEAKRRRNCRGCGGCGCGCCLSQGACRWC